jgi:hypothetical protein
MDPLAQLQTLTRENQALRREILDLRQRLKQLDLAASTHDCLKNPLLAEMRQHLEQELQEAERVKTKMLDLYKFEASEKASTYEAHAKKLAIENMRARNVEKTMQAVEFEEAINQLRGMMAKRSKGAYLKQS